LGAACPRLVAVAGRAVVRCHWRVVVYPWAPVPPMLVTESLGGVEVELGLVLFLLIPRVVAVVALVVAGFPGRWVRLTVSVPLLAGWGPCSIPVVVPRVESFRRGVVPSSQCGLL
jgi:hypothetical protein